MTRQCISCSKPLARGTKHDRCRGCFTQPKPDKFCGGCGVRVCKKQNKSGFCRRCLMARVNSDPVLQAKRAAAAAIAVSSPSVRAKLSAIQTQRVKDPANLEKWREAGRRNWRRTIGSEQARAASVRPDVIARRAKTHSERDMAWCPADRREEYRKLMKQTCAAEARRMILEDIAAQRARMTPFERQMDALNRGASLVMKPVFASREYDFTLGGVTDL